MLGRGSLRCRIGWHRPRAGGRWHHGYCFTKCERCGDDMVRSVFGEWHVPKGFRVVAKGDAAAVAALDAVLTARDAGQPVARDDFFAPPAAPPAPPPPRQQAPRAPAPPVRPRREVAPTPAGSPFDFGDFDAIDAAPAAASWPLSRAAP